MTKEEAISVFKDKLSWANQNRYPYVSQREAEAYRMEIKALEQEPKTGYWIEHEIKDTCRWLICSVCGYEWVNKKENFCPNCGAKMQEVKDGNK